MYHIVVRPCSHQADMIFFSTHVCGQKKTATVDNARSVVVEIAAFCPSVDTHMRVVPLNKNGNKVKVEAHGLYGNPLTPVIGSAPKNRDTLIGEALLSAGFILNYR